MNRDKVMMAVFLTIAIGIYFYFQFEQQKVKLIVDTTSYRELVAKAQRPRVVSFYAQRSAPCRQFKPVLEKVMMNYTQSVDCVVVNVDDRNSKAIVQSFRVTQIPAIFILDRKGNIIFDRAGYVDPDELDYYIKKTIF